MWGIVENLGLKEGLSEFTDQFNKDAKTTIANTSFAKERGIDVARLDEWEEKIKEQSTEQLSELHDRTIGLAVETLSQDDTLAQLLELKQAPAVEEDEVTGSRGGEGLSLPAADGPPETEPASTETSEPVQPEEATPPAPAVQASGSTAGSQASTARAAKSVRQMEAEIRSLKTSRDEAEQRLAGAQSQSAEFEASLAEMSAVSDDALAQAEEAKQQAYLLRRAVEEKDARMLEATEAKSQLQMELGQVKKSFEDLEASFQERLVREVSQKEQELLDEVAYLRKTGEAKERRVQELQAEKAAMERRMLVKASAGSEAAGEVMLEAHTAIARAFGDMTMEHPCLRLVDEPTLKLMAVLFKQPPFRRMFAVPA